MLGTHEAQICRDKEFFLVCNSMKWQMVDPSVILKHIILHPDRSQSFGYNNTESHIRTSIILYEISLHFPKCIPLGGPYVAVKKS